MQQIDSNEPASQLLAEEFADIMSKEDLQKMIELQTQIYEKLQQANATLTAFNDYSSTMYNTLFKDFDKYTKLMKEMKKDLNLIFRKIRYLKSKLKEKYPDSIQETTYSPDL